MGIFGCSNSEQVDEQADELTVAQAHITELFAMVRLLAKSRGYRFDYSVAIPSKQTLVNIKKRR